VEVDDAAALVFGDLGVGDPDLGGEGLVSEPGLAGQGAAESDGEPAPKFGSAGVEQDRPGVVVAVRAQRLAEPVVPRGVLVAAGQADAVCASELAANATQHSRSRLPGGTFTVRVAIGPGHHARIEVRDTGGPWNQGMIGPTRHHGLDIVRAVADEWGIDGDQTGRTIWARFDCPE
jgi:hypothetical protein